MKVLTIGRDESCDIVIDDNTDLVSRRHALLRIYPFGKMEIVPLGRNKTYLNGKEIPNERVREVCKSDVISFAKIKTLDWSSVSNPYTRYRNWSIISLIIVTILWALLYYYPSFIDNKTDTTNPNIENIGGERGGGSESSPEEYSKPEEEEKSTQEETPQSNKPKFFKDQETPKKNGGKSKIEQSESQEMEKK